jgi:hypothetical protein
MSIMADRSGYVNRTYEQEATQLIKGMKTLLFNKQTQTFFDGEKRNHSAWHAQTIPLWVGDIANDTKSMFNVLKSKGMVGSVYGAFSFLMGLYNSADYDRGHFALEMLTSCNPNCSWCHMIQVGATATMEAWTRKQKPNLSWSHPWVVFFFFSFFFFSFSSDNPPPLPHLYTGYSTHHSNRERFDGIHGFKTEMARVSF